MNFHRNMITDFKKIDSLSSSDLRFSFAMCLLPLAGAICHHYQSAQRVSSSDGGVDIFAYKAKRNLP